tara:strand:+ start:165 stop:491 length:327 start_codon:yes stop_codon:yes gene_type:complete
MQKTNFSRIYDQFNNLLFGFLSSSWRSKSINIISVLTGYFLFANFITKFISEGQNELIMVPIIIIIIELIIRIRPSPISSFFNLWSIVDKVRIGATYAIILEAFKLGS